MEKEVQEVQDVTPREEVAQPASVGSVTPQLGTDGSGDAPLLSSHLDPTGIHDVLSSTKASQQGVLSIHAVQNGVFT